MSSKTGKELDLRVGKFTVTRRLGRGGMGAVYHGYDPALDRPVAIKTLTTDVIADRESRNRFEREARAAAKLQHPNIVTVYELGNFGGREKPYIVMEYLEGTDVASLIGEKGLPLSEALDITIQLLRALEFAHQHGVVHRDVKPSNLRYLDNGQLKIMDFGIARVEGATQITKSGVMVGTVHYMSPEQIKGESVDGRSDIFSAGCILYEMLTGARPFPGESATAILYRIVHEQPTPVTAKNKDLPQEIQDLLDRALAKSAADRYRTAGEMARELEKILSVYRKTLPRTTGALQERVDEIETLAREEKWRDLVPRAKQLIELHPGLDQTRRLYRRGLRELETKENEGKLTEEERTVQMAEICDEITQLYGTAAIGKAAEASPAAPSTPVSGTSRRSIVPLMALAAAVVAVAAGVLYWTTPEPTEAPRPIEHRLSVRSDPPGASIWLNGARTDLVTSEDGVEVLITGMPNERVEIELRREGFESAVRSLSLGEAPPDPLDLALTPLPRKFTLSTEPSGASVRLNGQELSGVTPLEIILAPGTRHEIVLTKAEYRTQTITLEDGGPLPDRAVALSPLGRPGRFAIEADYPAAIYRGNTLIVEASPGPSVELRPGRYELRVVAPEVFLDWAVTAEIREEATTSERAPALGRLNVRANPGNCTVTIDGLSAGAPPFMNREIAAGSHEIVFTWPGGASDVQTVRIEPGKPAYVIGQRPQ